MQRDCCFFWVIDERARFHRSGVAEGPLWDQDVGGREILCVRIPARKVICCNNLQF